MAATDPAQFRRELTTRKTGFITETQQDTPRRGCILVAGCGSTGGAVVEPLVRLGVRRVVLADNGDYETNNFNRQNAIADRGRNKAQVSAGRATAIKPTVIPRTHPTDGAAACVR
jgi:tRNA A37 threonylcarbamoyladenosine dehydratase